MTSIGVSWSHTTPSFFHSDKIRALFGLKQGENPVCPTCVTTGMRKEPLKPQAPPRSTRLIHRFHLDIGFTRGASWPFQLYIDDYSRRGYIELLTVKSEVLQKWCDLKRMLENRHYPLKVAFIRTDNEFVYTSKQWGTTAELRAPSMSSAHGCVMTPTA